VISKVSPDSASRTAAEKFVFARLIEILFVTEGSLLRIHLETGVAAIILVYLVYLTRSQSTGSPAESVNRSATHASVRGICPGGYSPDAEDVFSAEGADLVAFQRQDRNGGSVARQKLDFESPARGVAVNDRAQVILLELADLVGESD